jgi:hypothetical protein
MFLEDKLREQLPRRLQQIDILVMPYLSWEPALVIFKASGRSVEFEVDPENRPNRCADRPAMRDFLTRLIRLLQIKLTHYLPKLGRIAAGKSSVVADLVGGGSEGPLAAAQSASAAVPSCRATSSSLHLHRLRRSSRDYGAPLGNCGCVDR